MTRKKLKWMKNLRVQISRITNRCNSWTKLAKFSWPISPMTRPLHLQASPLRHTWPRLHSVTQMARCHFPAFLAAQFAQLMKFQNWVTCLLTEVNTGPHIRTLSKQATALFPRPAKFWAQYLKPVRRIPNQQTQAIRPMVHPGDFRVQLVHSSTMG